jgi:hypothetical protein
MSPASSAREQAMMLVAMSTLFSVASCRDAAAIRPFDGTDAAVAAEGTVEFEMGPVDWIDAEGSDVLAPAAVVNVGVAHDWELSTYAQPSWLISEGGGRRFALLDDGLVGKRILREGGLQDRAGPSVAVEVAALLPATEPFDRFGARVTPVVSQTWRGFTGHLSASVYWTRLHQPAAAGSLIVEGPEVAARIRPAIEATTGWEDDVGRGWSGLAALLWNPREDLEFDLGFRLGRSFGASTQEIRAGFTWVIRAWDPPGH